MLKVLPDADFSTAYGLGEFVGQAVFWPLLLPLYLRLRKKLQSLLEHATSSFWSPRTARIVFIGLETGAAVMLLWYVMPGTAWVARVGKLVWEYIIRGPNPWDRNEYEPGSPDQIAGPLLHWLIKIGIALYFWRKHCFDKERKIRVLEEEHTVVQDDAWTPVYASQYASLGQINHHVIVIRNRKYELRKDNLAEAIYNTNVCTIDHSQRNRAREMGEATCGDDKFYIYLIGWTTKTHEKIDEICERILAGPKNEGWAYHPLKRNCQHYIRLVANDVVERQAADWEYFFRGNATPYQQHLFSRRWTMAPVRFVDSMLSLAAPGYAMGRVIMP